MHEQKVGLYLVTRPTAARPKRKVWVLRWNGTDGKRFSEVIGEPPKMSKRDAKRLQRDRQGKIDHGLTPVDRPQRMSLADFLERDREMIEVDVKPKTLREMKTAGNHAIKALGKKFDVRRFDKRAVAKVKKYLADEGLRAATITKVCRKLQGAFSRAVEEKVVPVNPFEKVRLPRTQPKPIRTYTDEEVRAMIEVAPPQWWKALLSLAYTTGFRRDECLNLMWIDINEEGKTVSVTAKPAGEFEAGGETFPVFEWSAKSYHERSVPVPQDTIDELRRLKAQAGGSRYVFLSLERLRNVARYMVEHGSLGANYTVVNNFRRDLLLIQERARELLAERKGQPVEWEPRTFHDLRRTYGSRMARHLPIHEVRTLMGHSSIKVTEQFYLACGQDLSERVRAVFAQTA